MNEESFVLIAPDDMVLNKYVWPVRGGHTGLAVVPKTGRTVSLAPGDDGDLEVGASWPCPRFTINTDTTITDNLTGLLWAPVGIAQYSNCGTSQQKTWQTALNYVACLNVNSYLGYNDWRLPNRKELRSLLNYSTSTADWLNGQGFSWMSADFYWTSTTAANNPGNGWYVNLYGGEEWAFSKSYALWGILPVHGGQ